MEKCKWEKDDFCVNADCEHCADFCNHYENPQECEYYETKQSVSEETTKQITTDAIFIYWQ